MSFEFLWSRRLSPNCFNWVSFANFVSVSCRNNSSNIYSEKPRSSLYPFIVWNWTNSSNNKKSSNELMSLKFEQFVSVLSTFPTNTWQKLSFKLNNKWNQGTQWSREFNLNLCSVHCEFDFNWSRNPFFIPTHFFYDAHKVNLTVVGIYSYSSLILHYLLFYGALKQSIDLKKLCWYAAIF